MSRGLSEFISLLCPSRFQGLVYVEITQAHSAERRNGLWRFSVSLFSSGKILLCNEEIAFYQVTSTF